MVPKFIPVADIGRPVRREPLLARSTGGIVAAGDPVTDTLGRPLRDLRISVTDRCNFRCVYCMPKAVFGKDHPFLPHSSLLTFEEIERIARVFVAQGVEKIRLTGGEPLLRKNLQDLIARLARLKKPDGGAPEITLTTNGSLLVRFAQSLRDAGLSRITVSLDALDDTLFKRMNDVDFPVDDVLASIAAAQAVKLPVKVNMVVKRGTNDSEILPMARHFRDTGVTLRFIEYMDVGESNGWNLAEVMPSDKVLAAIAAEFPLVEAPRRYPGETARRWRYADGAGEIGLISSVSHAFCGSCTRARLSTEGKLFLCLFASRGYDLRALLRGTAGAGSGAGDAELTAAISRIWQARTDRYSELRGQIHASSPPAVDTDGDQGTRVEMSYIGG